MLFASIKSFAGKVFVRFFWAFVDSSCFVIFELN